MATSKLENQVKVHQPVKGAIKLPSKHGIPVEKVIEVDKAIGGWKLARPEGKTVHVARPRGSKYFTDFVTKSAMKTASAALARLHQQ